MKKILVTGGLGYIGSHTVVELQQKGYEIVIIDALFNSRIEVLQGIEKITGIKPAFEKFDLCDDCLVEEFFQRHTDIEAVIHFAAHKAVGDSVNNPLKYYYNNLNSLINILKHLPKAKAQHIVFSSSCTVYGQPDQLPVDETSPIKEALSPYGHTKQVCEKILESQASSGEVKCILLRYFNPIGAHHTSAIGELPLGVPDNLIPYVTQTAAGIRECLSVYGDDYDTPDGTAIRDYIHVVDLAKAHVKAVERLMENKSKEASEVFNLGTGTGYSVMDVINAFEKTTHKKLNYRIVGRREGDIEKVWADTKKANEVLQWKSEKGIEEMMQSAWDWEISLKNKKNDRIT